MDIDFIKSCIIQSHDEAVINRFSCMGDFRMHFSAKSDEWKGKWFAKNEGFGDSGLLPAEQTAIEEFCHVVQTLFSDGSIDKIAEYAIENGDNFIFKGNRHFIGKEIEGGSYLIITVDSAPQNSDNPICISLYRENKNIRRTKSNML